MLAGAAAPVPEEPFYSPSYGGSASVSATVDAPLATESIASSTMIDTGGLGSLTMGQANAIQGFADRAGTTVDVVGSRAAGTATATSDNACETSQIASLVIAPD